MKEYTASSEYNLELRNESISKELSQNESYFPMHTLSLISVTLFCVRFRYPVLSSLSSEIGSAFRRRNVLSDHISSDKPSRILLHLD